ncbi:serine/threonine-protein kinase [Sphingopyxis terrae]|uniref:serine/threonine-protein kinase n=1 Tax=Sphingopyxis terrae TaxID=33052 RepID=UPI000786D1F6|nr:serine/threonine-protein kinase [Sphingopyxis terrae]
MIDRTQDLYEEEREAELAAADPILAAEARKFLARMEAAADFLEPAHASCAANGSIDPGPQVGDRYGAWRIEGLIGSGGMGSVYAVGRADGGFEQAGALKLIRRGPGVDAERLAAERQVLASLDHPHIARILDGGLDDAGNPWMVMERIDGPPCNIWCDTNQADLARRIALVIDAIGAVARAHQALILHRDLKPSNVLVDSGGRARVIDFGVAKQMALPTQTQNPLPVSAPYAPPELLTGAPVGPPCDVYGAAALLYELVTRKPPIELDGLPFVLGVGRILDTAPKALTAHRDVDILAAAPDTLVADLNAVLAKALRKEPADRYPTLEAFAADLQRVIDRAPVTARRGERGYAVRRRLWQWRWPIAAGVAIALSLVGGLAATLWQAREAYAARDAALAEEERSQAVRESLYVMLSESADVAGDDADRRDILEQSTRRIVERFARSPADQAPVLHALGELYFYLGDYRGAITALRPVVTAGGTNGIDPETLALSRYDLAQSLVRTGEIEEARPLLAQAQQYWSSAPDKWRHRLIDSRLLEAQIMRGADPSAAAALLQKATDDHVAMLGTGNRLAGVFQNNLGVALQASGDLPGARKALQQARLIWAQTGLTDTPDALNTANNLAAIEVLLGHPDKAAPIFAEAVRLREKLFGASGGTAALLSNYGKVLLQLGDAPKALSLLERAEPMAERFAGAGSILHVSALAGVSEAHIALAGKDEALAVARKSVAAAGSAPTPPRAIAHIALGRALAASGDKPGARAALGIAEPIVEAMGAPAARLKQGIADIKGLYRL